jgi:hypothetical protein
MSGDVRVIDDGVEQDQAARGPAPWLWIAIGFAVGLAAGVVFVAPAVTPSEAVATPTEDADVPAAPGQPTEGVGISRVVTDFPDAMVAIAETETGSLQYILWPYATDVVVRSLPVGSSGAVEVDDSGRWVAVTTALPGDDGALLSMGLTTGIAPLESEVASFSWSDTDDGVLGYTRTDAAGWGLWSARAVGEPHLVGTTDDVTGGELVAWGDWGWALARADAGFDLLTPEGVLRTTVSGIALDSHQSGWLLVVDDGVMMVSAGGGVRAIDDFPKLLGPWGGAISPDGSKVAVLGSNGLGWGPIDGSEAPAIVQVGSRAPQVSWSSDSRFVMIPGNRGVHVYDTESRALRTVLPEHLVIWVGVIPLTPAS